MRLSHCGSHPDCVIIDGVHTPKDTRTAEKFPDWPPTQGEVERDISDADLMVAFAQAIEELRSVASRLKDSERRLDALESSTRADAASRDLTTRRTDADIRGLQAEAGSVGNAVDVLRTEVSALDGLVRSAVLDATKKLAVMEDRSRWVDKHSDLWDEVRKLQAKVTHETEERAANTRKLMRSLRDLRAI